MGPGEDPPVHASLRVFWHGSLPCLTSLLFLLAGDAYPKPRHGPRVFVTSRAANTQRLEETVLFVSLLMQSAVSNVPQISDGIAGRKTGHLLNPQRHGRARSPSGCNIRN